MSYQDDLDWLARNVHAWPTETDFVFVGVRVAHGRMGWYPADYCFSKASMVTIQQWLARRAELQNKPSFADHSDAKCFVQNAHGLWFKNIVTDEVEPNGGGWRMDFDGYQRDGFVLLTLDGSARRGEVLGNWRDTLERRPADTTTWQLDVPVEHIKLNVHVIGSEEVKPVSVSNETVQLDTPIAVAGTGNGSASETAFLVGRVIDLLRSSMDHFSADELADLNELTGAELTKRDERVCGGQKYLDSHWFERGELPPVGIKCEFNAGPFGWFVCDIVAHYNGDAVFAHEENVARGKPEEFRPIRTERDLAVDEMKRHCPYRGSWETTYKLFAEALYDAGYRAGGAA